MTAPRRAITAPGGHRVYPWQGRLYPSVTTIIRAGIRGMAPSGWAVKVAAEYAIANQERLARLPAEQAVAEVLQAPSPTWGVKVAAEYAIANLQRLARLPAEQAVAEVQQAPQAGWETRSGLGDLVHAAVEAYATSQPLPELPSEAEPLLAAFDQFLTDHTPLFLLSEQTVYSRRYGYAGTLDAIVELPRGGTVTLLEIKTGKRVYPETALQLAAYAHTDFLCASDDSEQQLPPIHEAAVLHLQPDNYRLVPMPAGQDILDVFLAALAVFRWTTDLAPRLLSAADYGKSGDAIRPR
jgi:hypothetical protein